MTMKLVKELLYNTVVFLTVGVFPTIRTIPKVVLNLLKMLEVKDFPYNILEVLDAREALVRTGPVSDRAFLVVRA